MKLHERWGLAFGGINYGMMLACKFSIITNTK